LKSLARFTLPAALLLAAASAGGVVQASHRSPMRSVDVPLLKLHVSLKPVVNPGQYQVFTVSTAPGAHVTISLVFNDGGWKTSARRSATSSKAGTVVLGWLAPKIGTSSANSKSHASGPRHDASSGTKVKAKTCSSSGKGTKCQENQFIIADK